MDSVTVVFYLLLRSKVKIVHVYDELLFIFQIHL